MKKLILTLLIIAGIGFLAQSQTVRYNYGPIRTVIDTLDVSTGDTAWVYGTAKTYSVGAQLYWTGLTGTLTTVEFKLESTINGVSWDEIILGTDTLKYTPTAATGSHTFHITRAYGTDYKSIRLAVDTTGLTAGLIIPSFTFNEIK